MRLHRARAIPSAVCSSQPRDEACRAAPLTLFALLSAYLFFIVGTQRVAASSAWITGDWLINYSNGFLRRGLLGELARQLHYVAGLDPISTILAIKALLYATLCASLLMLAGRQAIGLVEIAIVLSPALLPFEINDPLGSGRKEIALLALFGVYVIADSALAFTEQPLHKQWRFWFLLLALPALTLTHEGLFFFFPFFVAYAWVRHGAAGTLRVFSLPYAAAAIAFVLSWIFRGGEGIAGAMCSSLSAMSLDPVLCGGATAALERYDVHVGGTDIERYLLLLVLTFGPLLWYATQALSGSRRRGFLVSLGIAAVMTTPLYLVSEDWGRWIHVTAVLVFLIVLACKDASVKLPARPPAFAASLAVISVYVFTWQMPHWIHSPLPIIRTFR